LAIAPKISREADDYLIGEPWFSLLWGGAAYLCFAPLIVLMIFSLIGIPLIPVVVFFATLFVLAGLFSACRSIGHLVIIRLGLQLRALDTLLGLVLLFGLCFTPFVGPPLVFFILMAGTGAMIRSVLPLRTAVRFSRMS